MKERGGKTGGTGRGGKRRKQLLDDVKERRRCCKSEEEALVEAMDGLRNVVFFVRLS